jgi:hypothetical protein
VTSWQKAMHNQAKSRSAGWLHRTAQHVLAEAVPAAFIAGTVQRVSEVSAVVWTAYTPSVAAIVKSWGDGRTVDNFLGCLVPCRGGDHFPLD